MPSVDCVQISSFLKNLFSYSNLFNNLVDNIKNWYCKVRHLLQNGTDSSYQKSITKCESGLLQSASGITKCDKLLLQNVSGITKWYVAMVTHTQSYVFQFQNFKPPWKWEHISNEHFQKLNWLPINQKVKQCVTSTVFKFVQNKMPSLYEQVFRLAENTRINTRNSYLKFSHLFRKDCFGYHKNYFSFFFFFLLHPDWRTTMKIRQFACSVLSLPYYFSSH